MIWLRSADQHLREHEARPLLGLTNTLVMFGGSKDVQFNQQISDLLHGPRRPRHPPGRWDPRRRPPLLRGRHPDHATPKNSASCPSARRSSSPRNGKPIIAKLHRCIEGKAGARLLVYQRMLRGQLTTDRRMVVTPDARAASALAEARRLGLVDHDTDHVTHGDDRARSER